MQSFVRVAHISRVLHTHSPLAFQDTVILQMGNSTLQRLLSHSVWICAMLLQFASSSGKRGDILMRMSKCYAHMCVCAWLDKTIARKGLNTCQAAYTNQTYKSHRRVGLPSNIIASLAMEDTLKSSQILIYFIYTLAQ